MTVTYTTRATATGHRPASVLTEDGALAANVVVPRERGGEGGAGTNPEQLFACCCAAGFLESLHRAGARAHVAVPAEAAVSAVVGLSRTDGGTDPALSADMTVRMPGVPPGVAAALVEMARADCPYVGGLSGGLTVRVSLG